MLLLKESLKSADTGSIKRLPICQCRAKTISLGREMNEKKLDAKETRFKSASSLNETTINALYPGLPGKGVRSHAHALVHASQHWEVRLIVFINNQLLSTIAPGISNHGLEQLTSVTHFDEQNME